MALDVSTVQAAIIQVLKDNTTTMAGSLTTASSIVTIMGGDARSSPTTLDRYPAIMVKAVAEDEKFNQIGQRNNMHELQFAIVPLIYESSNAEQSDKDVLVLTKNIKTVLKSNITLSSTALWSLPGTVDYFAAELDGIYCSASIITLRTFHLST